MSHKISHSTVPHTNADGKVSLTKNDHIAVCRSRGKVCWTETFTSHKRAEQGAEQHRQDVYYQHRKTHPNDALFVLKHRDDATSRPTMKGRRSPKEKPGERYLASLIGWKKARSAKTAPSN